jgi:hypothetical protein
MSVTLTSQPGEISFSADFINAGFQVAGHLTVQGVKSVNTIPIGSLTQPKDYVIQYGNTTVIMTAKTNPDNSGNEFPYIPWITEAPAAAEAALPYFQRHPILSTDFDITSTSDNKLVFTAKKFGIDYDFVTYNTLPGQAPKLKENYSVFVKLMIQDVIGSGYSEAYSAHLTLANGTNEATALFGDKLHQRLTADLHKYGPEIPASNAVFCNVSSRKYFFQYGESFGQPAVLSTLKNSPIYTVVHGGLSHRAKGRESLLSLLKPGTIANDRFLIQGPAEVSTREDQPQYLYFLNTRALVNTTIQCKFHFEDGTSAQIPLETYSLAKYGKFGFKVQFDKIFNREDYPVRKVKKYQIWLSAPDGSAISEIRSYVLDYSYRAYYKYFLSWNSWGALESRMFYGKGSVEFDLVQSVAERNTAVLNAISQGSSMVYNTSIQTKFSCTTGFIANKSLLVLNREFFVSAFKYILSGGNLLPIRVTSKTIGEIEDGNNLFAQKFEYQYQFEDHAYTEGDVYKPAPVPVRLTGLIYFGPSLKRPATANDVLSLPLSALPGSYLISLPTGANKFMNVAYPKVTKRWGSAFDNTSQENISSEYLPVDIYVDGIPYELRTMELARAYRENHDHILTINDV